MSKNTLLKVLTISILISSLFLTGCTTEEKIITVQDDVQKMSNELDEDGRIFTKVRDLEISETENAYIYTIANDASPVFSKNLTPNTSYTYTNLFTLNSDNSINIIENNLNGLFTMVNKNLITYFKGTELWIYDANTKEKQMLVNLPDIKEESENAGSMHPLKISGDNSYLSIVTRTQYDGYHKNIIRILDLETGEVYKSAPLKDLSLSQYFLYSKATNKFYTSTPYSENILEFSLDDLNPKEIARIPGIKVENFKMSYNGKYIYFMQKDRDSRELSFCKFDLQTQNTITLLKISPKEKDEDLFWTNFDIVGNTLVYAFFTNRASDYEPFLTKNKLYAANISEDSITNNQLLYSSPVAENSSIMFYLTNDGTKIFSSIVAYTNTESGEDTQNRKSFQYSLYEKTK
ncbi:hypothetical protein [Clostridium intestinale]|uniref:hypothetical protein n=1 Tax=Clostridium intestinale TaxID=36845 RepID=UPI002DD667A0|nr:hypothetical protein [Clostridium intestinale]WRY50853.1 hypothetical protein P8F83_19690 [Clostridium intestinale]